MKDYVEAETRDIGEDEKKTEEERREKKVERGNWSGKLDFFLALCGSSVGLGNVWRFPYLCYKHGGGAFLIPYLLSVFCAGIPLLVIEVGLGQFTGQGPVTAWGMISPLFKGIGCAGLVIQVFLNTYYVVIMAWGLYYLLFSFNAVLPYSTCSNDWNTVCCFDGMDNGAVVDVGTNYNMTGFNDTTAMMTSAYNLSEECPNATTSPTVEFWNRKVLQIHRSEGIHDVVGVSWQLFLCLTLAWLLIYLCICKGVKSSGKVVYVTVPFPYVLLTILLIRAVTLPNAVDGIIFYLKPDTSKLKDSQVWLDAATQIFYSNTLGQGFLVALGSYNKRNHNFVRDTLLYSLTNCATSLYSGFVIFAVLGFMAGKQGKAVGEVAKSGPGLGFIVYPEAITEMPLSTLWAILFFLCLLFLGIDSVFVVVEGLVTTIVDIFPKTLMKGNRREFFCAGCCLFFCMAGIPMVTYGGMFIFQLFDFYASSGFVLLWIALCESLVIGWVYGGKRYMQDIINMIGRGWIKPYMIAAWMLITPLFSGTIFVFSIVYYKPLTYENDYVYPWWGYMMGWTMALSSMVTIPILFIYQFVFKSKGSLLERWIDGTTSRVPESQENGPMDKKDQSYHEVELR
ncbi:sodium- and chloride-dependent betaine transporter-like isoform X1 [Lytechinus variegatus]|uniref:sodium- and chloride-dependent betaine transporter-like isoform X1 n=1 Tax=Lytechinus variegatus TaxID=7654 RepID=UPI001BB240C0|nr:sodium- and chloride-dependent betaine transporter-like isoform X1 [Lytechinus variegatus]